MFVVNLLSCQKESAKVQKNTIISSVLADISEFIFCFSSLRCIGLLFGKIKTAIYFSKTPFRSDKTLFYFAETAFCFTFILMLIF